MRIPLILCLLATLGCARKDERMPLETGRQVSYQVKTDYGMWVEPIRIDTTVPISGTSGVEFSGPLGSARMAWKDGVLLAQSTANGRFYPPIPLLAADGKPRTWRGRIETLGKVQVASALLVQHNEKLTLGTRNLSTTKATVTLKLPGGEVVLESWFQPEVGLVQQVQRTNGKRVLQMELLTGP